MMAGGDLSQFSHCICYEINDPALMIAIIPCRALQSHYMQIKKILLASNVTRHSAITEIMAAACRAFCGKNVPGHPQV
jgi:hypothetical protein